MTTPANAEDYDGEDEREDENTSSPLDGTDKRYNAATNDYKNPWHLLRTAATTLPGNNPLRQYLLQPTSPNSAKFSDVNLALDEAEKSLHFATRFYQQLQGKPSTPTQTSFYEVWKELVSEVVHET